jgi:hypothetical protein
MVRAVLALRRRIDEVELTVLRLVTAVNHSVRPWNRPQAIPPASIAANAPTTTPMSTEPGRDMVSLLVGSTRFSSCHPAAEGGDLK